MTTRIQGIETIMGDGMMRGMGLWSLVLGVLVMLVIAALAKSSFDVGRVLARAGAPMPIAG